MLQLEKNLIHRLGDAGWVPYWLPRLHTLSKVYAVKSPPYRKEAFALTGKIDTDINTRYNKDKADLERRKSLPIDHKNHLSRERYLREIAAINNKKREFYKKPAISSIKGV